jgi:hypothetical protein
VKATDKFERSCLRRERAKYNIKVGDSSSIFILR